MVRRAVMNEEHFEQRALDAVSSCLIRHLVVPKLFWNVEWQAQPTDLVALDYSGKGAVHVIEVKATARSLPAALQRLLQVPAHYKWLALPERSIGSALSRYEAGEFYSEEGPGRVGLIEVVHMAGDALGANILRKAERFPGSWKSGVEDFVSKHDPDIEFR